MAAIACSPLFSSVAMSPLSNAARPSATMWLMLVVIDPAAVDYFAYRDHDSSSWGQPPAGRVQIMTDGLCGVRAGRFPAPRAVVEVGR